MATSTFLSNATINITQGATTYDLSDQANQVTLTIGVDSHRPPLRFGSSVRRRFHHLLPFLRWHRRHLRG